jgi:hypothetical protein
MLNSTSDIVNEVIVRSGVATTTTSQSGLYTDAILLSWLNTAMRWAGSYRVWPFTEGRASTTYAGTEEQTYPENFKTDSIRFIQIDGKRFQKTSFEDYQIFKENNPSGNDRIYSDFSRVYFINPNSGISGTLTAYGQYTIKDLEGIDTANYTPFSNTEEDMNEAIVEEMISYARLREKNVQESEYHHQRAVKILDNVWTRYTSEQFAYQAAPNSAGMFKRFDIVNNGGAYRTNDEDQF